MQYNLYRLYTPQISSGLSLHNRTALQQMKTLLLFQVLNNHSSRHKVLPAFRVPQDDSWRNQLHVSNAHTQFLPLCLQMGPPHLKMPCHRFRKCTYKRLGTARVHHLRDTPDVLSHLHKMHLPVYPHAPDCV